MMSMSMRIKFRSKSGRLQMRWEMKNSPFSDRSRIDTSTCTKTPRLTINWMWISKPFSKKNAGLCYLLSISCIRHRIIFLYSKYISDLSSVFKEVVHTGSGTILILLRIARERMHAISSRRNVESSRAEEDESSERCMSSWNTRLKSKLISDQQ